MSWLVEHLHAVEVVGRIPLGKKAAGNVDTLRKAANGSARDARHVAGEEHHQNEDITFSSTYIRSCVDAGDVLAPPRRWAVRTA
jgi:riboflavin kinase/FMN adenylyltransferase